MTNIVDKILYLAWLKDKERESGEETLDCVHIIADPIKEEAQICEFVTKLMNESPNQFSLRNVPVKNIEITVLKVVSIDRGDVVGAVLME